MPTQSPLFILLTGLPGTSTLLLAELICRCGTLAEQSLDKPAPPTAHYG